MCTSAAARILRGARAGLGQFRSHGVGRRRHAQDRRRRRIARGERRQALCDQLFSRLARWQQGRGRLSPRAARKTRPSRSMTRRAAPRLAGPIDRAQFGATSWSDDSKSLYFIRLKRPAAGDPATDKYLNATADAWDLKSEPVAILGASVGPRPRVHAGRGARASPSASVRPWRRRCRSTACRTSSPCGWRRPRSVSDPKVAWTTFHHARR